MAIKDMKITQSKFDNYFRSSETISNMSKDIMTEYNEFMDNVISKIDGNILMKTFSQAKDIAVELDTVLWLAWKQREPSFFEKMLWSKSQEKTRILSIKQQADSIFKKYKDCFQALVETVEFQVAKWVVMDKYEKYFTDVEVMLEKKVQELPNETTEQKIIYSSAVGFLKNLKKMIITMKQNMVVMQWAIVSGIGLKEEMAAGMYHFEWLIKDILTSLTMDAVVTAAAWMVNSFRWLVEKHNAQLAINMVETAESVSEIRDNWIISMEAITARWEALNNAALVFKELGDKSQATHVLTMNQLEGMKTSTDDLKEKNLNYLTHNKPHGKN